MQSARPSPDWEQNCTWQFGIVCVFLQPIWLFQQNHQQCCKVCVRSKVALIASVSAARSHKAWPPSLSVNSRLHRLSANIRRPSRTTPLRFEMDRLLLESLLRTARHFSRAQARKIAKKRSHSTGRGWLHGKFRFSFRSSSQDQPPSEKQLSPCSLW